MPLFGRNKNKTPKKESAKSSTSKPTTNNVNNKGYSHHNSNNSTKAKPPAQLSSPPHTQSTSLPQQQTVKIVGDSKHVTTTRLDSKGQPVQETKIIKLTPEELQLLGGIGFVPTANSTGATSSVAASTSSNNSTKKGKQPVAGKLSASPQHHHHHQRNTPGIEMEYASPVSAASPQKMDAPSPPRAILTPDASDATPPVVQTLSVGDESLATIAVTRELVKQFIADIWNRGEIELIPHVCHPSLRFNGHVGMDRVGHEGFARMVTTVREALTDYHCEIHSMVVETNKAFCRLRFTGKHTGALLGYPPTGKTVSWMGASEFTCKNGKILKVWELGDVKSLEEQLRSVE